jgi:SWI/SNF-related matrix-associated actin-dependent regulator 1 of chromatin subfamily A
MNKRMIRDLAGIWHRLPFELPRRGQLMPFQADGAGWLAGRRNSLLADDMGLGKTCQAIEVINSLGPEARILIVCPAGLRLNWLRELARWLTAARRAQIAKRYIPDVPIVLVSYDLLQRFEVQLRRRKWDLLICDEAHLIRNPATRRARHVLGDEWREPLDADRRILMTGTPMPNRPIEMWPLLRCLGLRMSRADFGERFCGGRDFKGSSNSSELRDLLRFYMLRRMKREVLTELPEKTRQIIRIQPAGSALAAIRAEGAWGRQVRALEKFMGKPKLRDISELRHETAIAKIAMPVVQDMLQEAADSYGKLVVFCYHNSSVAAVAALFPGRCVTYTGAHSTEERQRAVDRFQRDPACQVFIGTIGAAGVGITLTAASNEMFLEEDWTPGVIDQAEDRCWRYGQRNAVLVQHIVLEGSIDARELDRQLSKAEVIGRTIDRQSA